VPSRCTKPCGRWGGMSRSRRDFRLLIAGQTITQVGTDVSSVAFPLVAVLVLHASPLTLGVLVAIQNGAFLVVGIPAGVLVDRVRHRWLLIATDLVRAAALLSITVMAAMGALTLLHMVLAAAVMSTARVVFEVGYQSYLPSLVERSELMAGNAKMEAVRAAGQIGGPGLGGWLVQLAGAANALIADAVSYLASAACLFAIRARQRHPTGGQQGRWWRQAVEGLRYVRAEPVLRMVAASSAISPRWRVGRRPIGPRDWAVSAQGPAGRRCGQVGGPCSQQQPARDIPRPGPRPGRANLRRGPQACGRTMRTVASQRSRDSARPRRAAPAASRRTSSGTRDRASTSGLPRNAATSSTGTSGGTVPVRSHQSRNSS
jgi:hypothetical protein